ncbi:hypothetical protein [Enterovibrio norvegicus]|uniref:hypothetical protein n=1 Tax=Enterovibrio norvegicus TaxID=188144 RepID=UPI000C82EAA3|nr:hypothetical protein [Enterovibrio norvegicus]PML80337.1 hypothetical protein BCT69_11230 [Enterovibrio norvegicus]
MKKNRIAQLMLASSIMVSTNVFAACYGNVYSMNAGRGHVGALIDLKESASLDSNYFQNASERAVINSKALFSSSAMAYDENTNRIYYSNVPSPRAYHINDADTFFSDEELNALDFHAKSSTRFTLAYYDVATGEHVEVANTKYQIMRMAFSPETGELYASDASRLFTVNPTSGETTQIALFPSGPRQGGFTNWGDFEFYKGELLFVTNGRSYSVDLSTADLTLKAFHFVNFVSSVTTDQNGQLIMAAKNQNVSGNVNNNRLWRLNPSTGEKVQVGLFPTRISAMATVTSEEHTCYEPTIFPSQEVTGLTTLGINDDPILEGHAKSFHLGLTEEATEDTKVNLSFGGSAEVISDYKASIRLHYETGTTGDPTTTIANDGSATLTIPAGATGIVVTVDSTDDNFAESDETVTIEAWVNADKSDLQTGEFVIKDDNDSATGSFALSESLPPGDDGRLEGGHSLVALVDFAQTTTSTQTMFFALKNGTAILGSDYTNSVRIAYQQGATGGQTTATLSASGTAVTIANNADQFIVFFNSINDSVKESTEFVILEAWTKSDKSDLQSVQLNITDND